MLGGARVASVVRAGEGNSCTTSASSPEITASVLSPESGLVGGKSAEKRRGHQQENATACAPSTPLQTASTCSSACQTLEDPCRLQVRDIFAPRALSRSTLQGGVQHPRCAFAVLPPSCLAGQQNGCCGVKTFSARAHLQQERSSFFVSPPGCLLWTDALPPCDCD